MSTIEKISIAFPKEMVPVLRSVTMASSDTRLPEIWNTGVGAASAAGC